jgi:acyl carrier protein
VSDDQLPGTTDRPSIREAAAAAWAATLGEGPPADEDNFFDSGGDSVQALNLIAELSGELDLAIPVTTVLLAPSFGALVAELSRLDG